MLMSDIIARRILEALSNSDTGMAEIQRNDLAETIGCVPSQINYVISSRFTPERGYIVESKRGGGGYIRITEVRTDTSSAFMHLINSVGNAIDLRSCRMMIENLLDRGAISSNTARLMRAAVSDTALKEVDTKQKDVVRAAIFKQLLMTQV